MTSAEPKQKKETKKRIYYIQFVVLVHNFKTVLLISLLFIIIIYMYIYVGADVVDMIPIICSD